MDISAVYSAGRLLIGVKGELDQHRARQIKAQAEEIVTRELICA